MFLQNKALISYGAKVNIAVATKQGTILYPAPFEEEQASLLPSDPIRVASDNYSLMNEGLAVRVELKLEHNTLLSNAFLSVYVFASVLALYLYYKAGLRKVRIEELEKSAEIERLVNTKEIYADNLIALEKEKGNLSAKYEQIRKELKNEKVRATSNEDEMIAEIVSLEEKMKTNLALQDKQRNEIDALKEKIKRSEGGKPKAKNFNAVQKRFKTLYKKISINERAITGFMELTDDLKIKSEEIIHQLNEDPGLVPVKRKVFGAKSREKVLEVIFAYKGRLYFRKPKDSKIEILALGTKNTQAKELEFLSKL
ncbi:MAG: hypothetical protein SV775_09085 [Thermodesulfobacteriota bacterium]|nr:hypothetical protein [Thermodesulfobacteriota bacterium]